MFFCFFIIFIYLSILYFSSNKKKKHETNCFSSGFLIEKNKYYMAGLKKISLYIYKDLRLKDLDLLSLVTIITKMVT